MKLFSSGVFLCLCAHLAFSADPWPELKPARDSTPLPGTAPLTLEGDISLQLAEGCDRFLDRQIEVAAQNRGKPDRENLKRLLGLDRDPRPEQPRFEYYQSDPSELIASENIKVFRVRWLAFGDVHGEGLLLVPRGENSSILADVIVLPDADQTPESLSGLADSENPYALKLALAGCRVLVPTLINREVNAYKMTQREWLHRPAFALGRTLIGYELHKVLSGAECLRDSQNEKPRPLGIYGWGEGGLLALYGAALDEKIGVTGVSGYFGEREKLWNEPADHNIFGLVRDFGDAEIASLIAPRRLVIGNVPGPDFVFGADSNGQPMRSRERTPLNGKPGKFQVINPAREVKRIPNSETVSFTKEPLADFTNQLLENPRTVSEIPALPMPSPEIADARHASQVAEIEDHNQRALTQAAADRAEYFKALDTSSLEKFQETVEPYREKFRTDVIGDFELDLPPFNARTRKYQEGPKTISYEVVLDVFEDVISYGILTLPKDLDLSGDEKRPVVVCQHGLEGTPQDVIGEAKFKAYKAFATRLAERGFITFAPQNNYKFFDLFRIQQFKAQSIGKTLFSIIVPSHQQITDWLSTQPYVDPDRIAFYGLSYGGKSAMRIPPLVDNYCLSICSADFNEWVWKNAATDSKSLRYSYANKGEYEIFEWNLGGTFNYAEMAWLIAPRPFMVERGHFDGVAPDETVAYEFAKVRNLYQAKLGIGDRCEIEWFAGPHSINGEGTYRFLEHFLNHSKAK